MSEFKSKCCNAEVSRVMPTQTTFSYICLQCMRPAESISALPRMLGETICEHSGVKLPERATKTLLDEFALDIIKQLISDPEYSNEKMGDTVFDAYHYASLMIKERKNWEQAE